MNRPYPTAALDPDVDVDIEVQSGPYGGSIAVSVGRAGRVRSMNPTVAATIDELTPAWLSGALGREVVAVEPTRIGTGQMGTTYRLRLRYADPAGGPAHLVAKLAATEESTRVSVAAGYRKEFDFYDRVVSTVDIRTPRCHTCVIAPDHQTFTLLLEDMAGATVGVQVDGCAPEAAEVAVRNLAGLHAPRWNDATLLEVESIRPADPGTAAFLGELHATATEGFVARYHDRLSAEETATLREASAAMARWMVARPEPFAPTHGDYRLDNLLFTSTGEVIAVDWQTLAVAPPARDLAYFLATSLVPEVRRTHEAALVAAYHDALVARGVTGYDAEQCFADYRLAQLQAPLITVLGCEYAAARTPASDEMFLAMATRSAAAIRDLDALGALDRA